MGVVTVPIDAIEKQEEQTFCVLVNGERHLVELGVSTDSEVEVLSGLKVGDVVRLPRRNNIGLQAPIESTSSTDE